MFHQTNKDEENLRKRDEGKYFKIQEFIDKIKIMLEVEQKTNMQLLYVVMKQKYATENGKRMKKKKYKISLIYRQCMGATDYFQN